MKIDDYSLEDLPKIAHKILHFDPSARVFALHGEMGAGKTTLIREICKSLNITTEATSPTFSIINQYESEDGTVVYHFDFYRLDTMEEALDLGCEDYFESGAYCFIEWPEIILGLLPETFIKLELVLEKKTRSIYIKKGENVKK